MFSKEDDNDGASERDNDDSSKGTTSSSSSSSSDVEKKKNPMSSFFDRLVSRVAADQDAYVKEQQQQQQESTKVDNVATLTVDVDPTTTSTSTRKSATTSPSTIPPPVPVPVPDQPKDDAVVYRSMAERARLEAERMDAELTLTKIDKLEKQLIKAKAKGDTVEDVQRQLDSLQSKLRGETVSTVQPLPPVQVDATLDPKEVVVPESSIRTDDNRDKETRAWEEFIESKKELQGVTARMFEVFRKETLDGYNQEGIVGMPEFMVRIMAASLEMDYQDGIDIDKKELRRRFDLFRNQDYSYSTRPKPQFTHDEIDQAVTQLQQKDGSSSSSDLFASCPVSVIETMKAKAGDNVTQLAVYALEQNYYAALDNLDMTSMMPKLLRPFAKDVFESPYLQVTNETDSTSLFSKDTLIENLYPPCTRKEDGEPTISQVEALVTTVLPAAKFSSSSRPQKVPGGFFIEGKHKYKNGDELLEAIDNELAKSPLRDKMTVLYVPAIQKLQDSLDSITIDDLMDIDSEPDPVLYVIGPDIVRAPNRLGLTVTSILGLATSWYLSIYPFLLNDGIGRRLDQDLQLLEANLQPDLTWLTDLSVPLFVSFIGLQLVHEVAHRVVASMNGVKLSIPTFVPSLITGITSSVTTFKTVPKNKEVMFDVSAAGPLWGIVASSFALALGTKLTLISDPSTLPALPLDILRQSTLGGAIIENIMPGVLYSPEGASVAGMTIGLHPLAIAGYISLIVNALSLLPIGSKYNNKHSNNNRRIRLVLLSFPFHDVMSSF